MAEFGLFIDTHAPQPQLERYEVGLLSPALVRGAERPQSAHTHRSHQAAMAHGHRRRLGLDGVLEHRQELRVALAAVELARE